MPYQQLSLSAQTAYAELFENVRSLALIRSAGNLNGSFSTKVVQGGSYWYFAYRDVDQRVRQLYIGPDDEGTRTAIANFRKQKPKDLAPLAKSATALGGNAALPRHFRIVRRLSEYGFFHAGGVLVGTHAFLSIGNLLGLKFLEGARTLDVDFAHAGRNISLALPSNIEIKVGQALDSLQMGFIPITEFRGNEGATFLNPNDPEFRIDFLTAKTSRGNDVVRIPNLDIGLQPLKFMEFSLEDTTQATLFCDEGAVLVNIPSPARFAVHKLIVYGERTGSMRIKSQKDLLQAAALFEYFAEERPAELRKAWKAAVKRGKGWLSRAEQGRKALERLQPGSTSVLK